MTEIQDEALDRIPEIRFQMGILRLRRDKLIERLIAGNETYESYLAIAGEVRGLQHAIRAPYVPREPERNA